MALQSAEENFQRAKGISVSICPLAFTRSGDVENVYLMIADKIDHQLCGAFGGSSCCIDQHVRPLEFVTAFDRIFGSAAQLIEVNYHRAIRVLHILPGALGETSFF